MNKEINRLIKGKYLVCLTIIIMAGAGCKQTPTANQPAVKQPADYRAALTDTSIKSAVLSKTKPSCCKGAPSRTKALTVNKKR